MIRSAADVIQAARGRGFEIRVKPGPPPMPYLVGKKDDATPALVEALKAFRLEIIDAVLGGQLPAAVGPATATDGLPGADEKPPSGTPPQPGALAPQTENPPAPPPEHPKPPPEPELKTFRHSWGDPLISGEQWERFEAFEVALPGIEAELRARRVILDGVKIDRGLPLYHPGDVFEAHKRWGCNCGPAALAAAIRRPCEAVRALFPGFSKKSWVNPSGMLDALRAADVKAVQAVDGEWPEYGLAWLHVTGPWTGGKAKEVYQHSHWIAVAGGQVWDVNGLGWPQRADWEKKIMTLVVAANVGANGWALAKAWDLE